MFDRKAIFSATCAIAALAATPAAAQTYVVGARGTPVAANLSVTPPATTATVAVGPLARAQGQGPGAFSTSNNLAATSTDAALFTTLNLGLGGVQLSSLTTAFGLDGRLLNATASGTVAGATATASVANLGTGIDSTLRLLGGGISVTNLFDLSAATVSSIASVDATTGAFTGSSSIAGLGLTGSLLAGLPLSATLNLGLVGQANPAANSVLLDALGLRVVLNEQITAGNLFTTNAISLRFTDFAAGTGLVNGTVVIGQSQVERIAPIVPAAVPEPASWAMMIGGFALVGAAMRRRRPAVRFA